MSGGTSQPNLAATANCTEIQMPSSGMGGAPGDTRPLLLLVWSWASTGHLSISIALHGLPAAYLLGWTGWASSVRKGHLCV